MSIKTHCGDFKQILKDYPDEYFDTIITDPPYARKYLYLYKDLAVCASRVLKKGGSLLSIVPHFSLPEILPIVSHHLKYRWIIAMFQDKGAHPRMAMGIEVLWKPIVWWVKDSWPQGRGFVVDGFRNLPPDKNEHKWTQSKSWAEFCLRFVPKNGRILDPMMGTGTVPIVAKHYGLDIVGIEIDEETFHIAENNLER